MKLLPRRHDWIGKQGGHAAELCPAVWFDGLADADQRRVSDVDVPLAVVVAPATSWTSIARLYEPASVYVWVPVTSNWWATDGSAVIVAVERDASPQLIAAVNVAAVLVRSASVKVATTPVNDWPALGENGITGGGDGRVRHPGRAGTRSGTAVVGHLDRDRVECRSGSRYDCPRRRTDRPRRVGIDRARGRSTCRRPR